MALELERAFAVAAAEPGAAEPSQPHPVSPASPRKDAPNPQQGMSDHAAASVSATTAATATNTACTSPLTVTSLEAAAGSGGGVPEVVGRVAMGPVAQPPAPTVPAPAPSVEEMLAAPMAELGLSSALPPPPPRPAVVAPRPVPAEEKRTGGSRIGFQRTPPTQRDKRKIFVGGLPTDVTDPEFLDFFKKFGDVIDSVVMVDRVTKRSRGFGFVTFASEKDATALLTAIPGKTGYVTINDKQCEVKASTPKIEDGTSKHGHHGHGHPTGVWRSNYPRHDNHRGYSSRHHAHSPPMGTMKHNMAPQKPVYIDNEFNGDVDGRNFDQLCAPQPQMNASYQSANAYGRNVPPGQTSMYHNYPNYPNSAPGGYAYPNSSALSVPSSWDPSYTAPNQAYGQYAPKTPGQGSGGHYNHYQYPNQYPAQYGTAQYGSGQQYGPAQYDDSSMAPSMMGQEGYAGYNGYYDEGGAPMPSQAIEGNDEGDYEPYPGDYGQEGTSDQY